MINKELLMRYGAELVCYEKDDFVFEEGMPAEFFYQIVSGQIKLNTYEKDDKEFIYSIRTRRQSFGEPTLFLGVDYLCNAIAMEKTFLYVLSSEAFFLMLKENHHISLKVHKSVSHRLYFKGIMLPDITTQDSERRVMTLLNYLKENWASEVNEAKLFTVDLTRQQIGDMTGLRVETVIRTIKKLKSDNKLRIIKGKIVL